MAAPKRLRLSIHPANERTPAPLIPCIMGETIRYVRLWSEEQWDRLPTTERPDPAEYIPGVGWIGVVKGKARS